MKSKKAELLIQGLTILSFVTMCWVAKRALEERIGCVNSAFLSFVQIDGKRLGNCMFENRLSFERVHKPVTAAEQKILNSLDVLEPLKAFLGGMRIRLAVDITGEHPDLFELGKGYVRIGKNWMKEPMQVRRALVMGVLRTEFPATYTNQFQLEVITDFLLLSVFNSDDWRDENQNSFSLKRDMKFSTITPAFDQYCLSPFRSLSHRGVCSLENGPHEDDLQSHVWGIRPLLATALFRVYDKLSIKAKMRIMNSLRTGQPLPSVADLPDVSAEALVHWFQKVLNDHLIALKPGVDFSRQVKRTMKELEVEAPTHWELTVDLTNTPAWREILEQMRRRSEIVKGERILIFTPEGARALPSGLPVAWAADEISSQKHVLIACEWPRPEDTVHIRARHMFAQQSCDKLARPFWD